MVTAAINGFGRIGRATFKILLDTPGFRVAAVNDLVPPDTLAYLLRYDTVYGRYERKVQAGGDGLLVDGTRFPVYHEKDPARLPWRELGVDLVFECTGVFNTREHLLKHLQAGAGSVILSAPAKDGDIPTVVHKANRADDHSTKIISCASCTTNCITPLVEIVGRRIGIQKAIMTTVHAYTATQSVVDAPNKKFRRGRAAAANLVPSSTGAARATTRALPQYAGKFDGIAVRAPVPVGSLADIVVLTTRATTVEELNTVFTEEANGDRYQGIVGVTEDPIVSSDIIRDPRAAIVDLGLTQVVDGNLVKVMAWYDNEWGYCHQMVREAGTMFSP